MQDVLSNLLNLVNENLEIKGITNLEIATIESIKPLSIKLANDKILSKEFLIYTPKTLYLKNTDNELELNSKLLVLKKLGGQQYLIFDFLEDVTLGNTISTVTNVAPLKINLANGKILERLDLMIFNKDLANLKSTSDIAEIGKKLITTRETGTGKYIFIAESE